MGGEDEEASHGYWWRRNSAQIPPSETRPQSSAMRSRSTRPHLTSRSSVLVSGVGSNTLRSTTSRRTRSGLTSRMTWIGWPGGVPACLTLFVTTSDVTSRVVEDGGRDVVRQGVHEMPGLGWGLKPVRDLSSILHRRPSSWGQEPDGPAPLSSLTAAPSSPPILRMSRNQVAATHPPGWGGLK